MTEIYIHFLFSHYGLYANAPVRHCQMLNRVTDNHQHLELENLLSRDTGAHRRTRVTDSSINRSELSHCQLLVLSQVVATAPTLHRRRCRYQPTVCLHIIRNLETMHD